MGDSLKYYPSVEVKAFGEALMMHLYEANIRLSLGGLGGCQGFNLHDFPTETHQYILEHQKGNCDSIAIVYAAMRDKEEERAP